MITIETMCTMIIMATYIMTITIYFIHPSGKFKLSSDRTAKNIS